MKIRVMDLSLMRAFAVGTAAALLSMAASADDKSPKKEEKPAKSVEVKVEDLKLLLPTTWKRAKLSPRSMRKGQFNIPAVKGEKDAVEIAIFQFRGGGGGTAANIRRWVSQFSAKGRTVKVTKGTCPQGEYHLVDIKGTFNMSVGPIFQRKTKAVENGRMIGIILGVKAAKKTYFIKTGGNGKTVSASVAALRAAIGADKKKEKEVDPSGK